MYASTDRQKMDKMASNLINKTKSHLEKADQTLSARNIPIPMCFTATTNDKMDEKQIKLLEQQLVLANNRINELEKQNQILQSNILRQKHEHSMEILALTRQLENCKEK